MSKLSKFVKGIFGGGEQDDQAARLAQEDEARKASLRRRVDEFYGIDTQEANPIKEQISQLTAFHPFANINPDFANAAAGVDAANAARTKNAAAARSTMEAENTSLGGSVRDYYTDALNRDFSRSERQNRFALARQGLTGGSADIDANAELATDRNLGATRISEAVGRSVNDLINQREQERLSAYNLISGGAGEAAVNSAVAGLKRSFDTASTQNKAELFSDLFRHGADAVAANNAATQDALLAQRYRDRINTFFSPTSSTSGRVTASG